MTRLLLSLLLLLAVPAAAQAAQTAQPAPEPEWRQASETQVLLTLSTYEPQTIRLVAGQPARLVFYNQSRASLSLDAGNFFAAARVRSGDDRLVSDGGITLAPGETRAITLIPREGRYRMRSRNLFRRLIGMSALIVVEPAAQG